MTRRASAFPMSGPGRRRDVAGWIVVAWASVLVLPWYKIESGWFAFDWLAHPADARPAMMLAWQGHPWLLPLLLAPLLATLLFFGRRLRGIGAAGAFGLAWLVAEGFAVIHSGWGFAWLAALAGTRGPVQPGLGFGATKRTRWFGVRIDHVLAGPGWTTERAWIGPDLGSDHLPMVADLRWSGGRAER